MYVHVDVTCGNGEIDKVWHLHTHGYHTLVGIHHRLMEIRVLHISAINKEILLHPLLLCRFRFADKSRYTAQGCLHLNGQQVVVEPLTKDIHNALSQCTRMKIHHLQSIAMHGERYLGIDECYALKGCHYVIEFGGVALKEFPSCRYIIEQVLYLEITAYGTCHGFLSRHSRTFECEQSTYLPVGHSCAQFHLCHSCNGGERLTTESHGVEVEQVGSLLDLGCGMAFKGQSGVGVRHTLTVIYHLYHRASGIYNQYVDGLGTRVNSVFHEFLNHRRGALYHLSRRNLVGH